MKKGMLALLLFLQLSVALGQNFELGNVTVKELAQKNHEKDTAAPAAILFKKAKTIFKFKGKDGFSSYTEVLLKIKIYKESGLDWANYKIPYYIGYESLDDESVVVSKAYSYHLENGKVVKTKVADEGRFSEDVNEFWRTKTVVFPNVKPGAIIELKYLLRSQYLSVLPEFQFQHSIPVNYAEYVTEIPEFYIYKSIKNGFVPIDYSESLSNISIVTDNNHAVFCQQLNSRYVARDVPALEAENYVTNISNYFGKIELELQTIRMPDQPPKQISATWKDVVKSIYDEKTFGPELLKMNYFFNDLQFLLKDAKSDADKLSRIFSFIKKRMTWNGKYSYSTRKSLEEAYKDKTGNSAEVNLILVAMLKIAALESNPVILSTKSNGTALFPNRSRLNHVIASVKIGNEVLLLDAINKYAIINILPFEDLNGIGRVIESDGNNAEIQLAPKENSKNYTVLMAEIMPNAEVSGKIKQMYYNHNALRFRQSYSNSAKEHYLEVLENKYNNLEIKEYSVENNSDALELPVIENYTYTANNLIDVIGDKMYFNPMLFLAQTKNPFLALKRVFPVNFVFSNQEKYVITIKIPDGYVIESIPTQKSIAMPGNLGSFRFIVQKTEKQIQLAVNVDINVPEIPAEYYETLQQFFDEIVKTQTEKVVLRKA